MELTLSGIVIAGIWFVAALRGISSATFFTLLTIPLGAASIINVPSSGLSILALQFLASLTTVLALLQLLATGRGTNVRLPISAWILVLLCLYGALSAFIMPRLFFHEILVVPYQKAIDGVRLSEVFYTTLIPLAPSSSNISQPGYLIASFGFFLVMLSVARRKGPGFLSNALLASAALNAVLGLMDMFRLDVFLNTIRTANYAIAADWTILGADRLVGGFPEPSSFGSVSATFAAYGLSIFFDRHDWRAGLIGIANAVLALLALSTTGWLGLGVVGLVLFSRTVHDLVTGGGARRAMAIIMLLLPLLIAAILALVLTPAGQYVVDMGDRMIFSKGESASGLERGAWATEGYRVFRETLGFGAGLGSIRSNGIVPVILSNIGWPGLLLALAFLWSIYLRPAGFSRHGSPDAKQNRILFRASIAGTITSIAMLGATAVVVDPGILFFAFAAIALTVRTQSNPLANPNEKLAYAK
jgi:hypothetical protein